MSYDVFDEDGGEMNGITHYQRRREELVGSAFQDELSGITNYKRKREELNAEALVDHLSGITHYQRRREELVGGAYEDVLSGFLDATDISIDGITPYKTHRNERDGWDVDGEYINARPGAVLNAEAEYGFHGLSEEIMTLEGVGFLFSGGRMGLELALSDAPDRPRTEGKLSNEGKQSAKVQHILDKRRGVVAVSQARVIELMAVLKKYDDQLAALDRQHTNLMRQGKKLEAARVESKAKKIIANREVAMIRAVRYTKLNGLATLLARNSRAQIELLKAAYAARTRGDMASYATIKKAYEDIGRSTQSLLNLREKQVQKWTAKKASGRKPGSSKGRIYPELPGDNARTGTWLQGLGAGAKADTSAIAPNEEAKLRFAIIQAWNAVKESYNAISLYNGRAGVKYLHSARGMKATVKRLTNKEAHDRRQKNLTGRDRHLERRAYSRGLANVKTLQSLLAQYRGKPMNLDSLGDIPAQWAVGDARLASQRLREQILAAKASGGDPSEVTFLTEKLVNMNRRAFEARSAGLTGLDGFGSFLKSAAKGVAGVVKKTGGAVAKVGKFAACGIASKPAVGAAVGTAIAPGAGTAGGAAASSMLGSACGGGKGAAQGGGDIQLVQDVAPYAGAGGKKGLSTGAKIGIVAGGVGILGALAFALSRRGGAAATVHGFSAGIDPVTAYGFRGLGAGIDPVKTYGFADLYKTYGFSGLRRKRKGKKARRGRK